MLEVALILRYDVRGPRNLIMDPFVNIQHIFALYVVSDIGCGVTVLTNNKQKRTKVYGDYVNASYDYLLYYCCE